MAFNEPDNERGELILKAIVEFFYTALNNERQKVNWGWFRNGLEETIRISLV